jgi:hypothetical protein
MNHAYPHFGRFAASFRTNYLRSLTDYRFYYDDLTELGNPAQADHVFYFVPGINGTPGQMRFLLPSLMRVYGPRLYLKALHLPEFSATRATWEKYTVTNVERKLTRLRTDLADLLDRFRQVTVLCSSNGFYDFAAAAGEICTGLPRGRLQLLWGACAPDRFKPSFWEKVLFPLNGFMHEGHPWFAYPNHNLLKALNPETSTSCRWQDGDRPRTLLKADLESRFRWGGLDWCYTSVSQLGAMTRHVVDQIRGPLNVPALALVAANDGYWQGRPHAEIEQLIRNYLPQSEVVFRPASHLWVVTPSYVTEMLETLRSWDGHPVPTTRRAVVSAQSLSASMAGIGIMN